MKRSRSGWANGGLAVMNADGSELHMITPRSAGRPRFIDWGAGTP